MSERWPALFIAALVARAALPFTAGDFAQGLLGFALLFCFLARLFARDDAFARAGFGHVSGWGEAESCCRGRLREKEKKEKGEKEKEEGFGTHFGSAGWRAGWVVGGFGN